MPFPAYVGINVRLASDVGSKLQYNKIALNRAKTTQVIIKLARQSEQRDRLITNYVISRPLLSTDFMFVSGPCNLYQINLDISFG